MVVAKFHSIVYSMGLIFAILQRFVTCMSTHRYLIPALWVPDLDDEGATPMGWLVFSINEGTAYIQLGGMGTPRLAELWPSLGTSKDTSLHGTA
ncbi:hypothetical protein MCOR07_000717 [Pyricularia oryzae]|nr:hypothetical protein MCOR07_000717 [Pyricularia oryzae]